MKKIGEYTARGIITSNNVEQIHLFDGKFTTGYRVTKFIMVITAFILFLYLALP